MENSSFERTFGFSSMIMEFHKHWRPDTQVIINFEHKNESQRQSFDGNLCWDCSHRSIIIFSIFSPCSSRSQSSALVVAYWPPSSANISSGKRFLEKAQSRIEKNADTMHQCPSCYLLLTLHQWKRGMLARLYNLHLDINWMRPSPCFRSLKYWIRQNFLITSRFGGSWHRSWSR